jgi:hypothetical protein
VHTRDFVYALEDIMWMDKGILHRGQGFTRHVSSKEIFIYSDPDPPAKGGVEVEVSFPSPGDRDANLRMRAQSLIIRVESPSSPEEQHRFAILDRRCKVQEGVIPLKRGTRQED